MSRTREKLIVICTEVTVTYTTGAGDLSTYDLSSELPSRVFVKSTTKSGDLARIIHSPIKI